MEQEIITFYEDNTEQKALFPTTTSNAVKWDESKTLPQYLADNLGLQMDLLWENANPTADFPPQTIGINPLVYKQIIIETVWSSDTSNPTICYLLPQNGQGTIYTIWPNASYDALYVTCRGVTFSAQGLTFKNGVGGHLALTSLSIGTNAGLAKPYRIYGIK